MAEWLRATGSTATVRDEANWFFTRDVAHAVNLTPSPNQDVVLLVNAHILSGAANTGQRKSNEFILSAFPNHFVVLESPVTQPTPDTVQMDIWTWGSVHRAVTLRRDVFEANYYERLSESFEDLVTLAAAAYADARVVGPDAGHSAGGSEGLAAQPAQAGFGRPDRTVFAAQEAVVARLLQGELQPRRSPRVADPGSCRPG